MWEATVQKWDFNSRFHGTDTEMLHTEAQKIGSVYRQKWKIDLLRAGSDTYSINLFAAKTKITP